jgi:hypothetical protein
MRKKMTEEQEVVGGLRAQRMMNLADPWSQFFAAEAASGMAVEVCPCRDNAAVHQNTSCLPS